MKTFEKVFYRSTVEQHQNKNGWAYQLYEIESGFGYFLFDEMGQKLVDQPPTQNAPRPAMTKAEATVNAEQSLEQLPGGALPYRYELYESPYGIGYRIFEFNGQVCIDQPFAPGMSGFAGMTHEGATKIALATINQLSPAPGIVHPTA